MVFLVLEKVRKYESFPFPCPADDDYKERAEKHDVKLQRAFFKFF